MATRCERPARRPIDGLLLVDKPAGVTSNRALQSVRRLYRAEKAGHTGTLDPIATGLLPVLFGEATKFGSSLLDADKTYRAAIALGVTTTTADSEGQILERRPVVVTYAGVEQVLARFRGEIAQVPPMYSALKRDGRPLYEYARAGQSVDRAARPVTIHELGIDELASDELAVTIRCSKGTYVRVLAEEIGQALGCGAHLASLRRVAVGPLSLDGATTIEALEELSPASRDALLAPVDALVEDLPAVALSAAAADRFLRGQAVAGAEYAAGRVRVYQSGGVFLGVGEAGPDGQVRPRRLLRRDGASPRP